MAREPGRGRREGVREVAELARRRRSPWPHYLWAAGAVGVCTLAASTLGPFRSLTNLIMLFLLNTVLIASLLGWGPSLLATLCSVGAMAFFFMPPYFSFAVQGPEYALTLTVMLLVSALISHLTARSRRQAELARRQERQTAVLYEMCQTLPAMLSLQEMLQEAAVRISQTFASRVSVLMPKKGQDLQLVAGEAFVDEYGSENLVARWVYRHGHLAGLGTETLPKARGFYLPLRAGPRVIGVLRLEPTDPQALHDPKALQFLEALGAQISLAIHREMLARQAQEVQVQMETERLRNTLLSSVSHDLRTPLTVIAGSASILAEEEQGLDPATRRELAQTMYEEACRLEHLVANLLEMSRLQAGQITLQREWNALEEVIGTALTQLENQLKEHPVTVTLPPDTPLVQMDTSLMERVFLNLLENAAKYTPPGTPLHIFARPTGGDLLVEVTDAGPGLPPGQEHLIFEKFYQVAPGRSRGAGLGLAICRGIIEAHDGRIWAANRPGGGAVFVFTLPLGEAPPPVDHPHADMEGADQDEPANSAD